MSQKRDGICAKKHPGMHEIAPFFPETLPLQRSLAPSKLNFAATIKIRWLCLCAWGVSNRLFIIVVIRMDGGIG